MLSNNFHERIKNLLGENPITINEIKIVEKELNIKIPQIFIEINSICVYEYSNSFDFFVFGTTDQYSVVENTKGLWNSYPSNKRCLNLYSDDAGILLMELNENASVMWCSIYDLENYLYDKSMTMKYDYFPTFYDFFEYLLDEEEKIRVEER